MVSNDVYRALEDALGPENVSQELGVIDGYSWQPALNLGYDAWCPRPEAVVLPQTPEEVQAVVKICNRFGLKFKAFSTGWASWGSPGGPGVIQIDLRRMNRIIDIDEKNMFAIVEPYVCGSQMQSEAMKRGLNTHLIGAGPNCSQLANATSGWGYGWTGLYTGFSGRNPLGVEWVLPDGEILRIGTPGSNGQWFSGDGPGPSLRGIMRGWGGAQGGLGIFITQNQQRERDETRIFRAVVFRNLVGGFACYRTKRLSDAAARDDNNLLSRHLFPVLSRRPAEFSQNRFQGAAAACGRIPSFRD